MLRWLHRLLDERYSAPVPTLAPTPKEAWGGLLEELADGYTKHEAVFRAIQLQLRSTRTKAMEVPTFKTLDELERWKAEQYGLVREAAALEWALKIPVLGARIKARQQEKKTEPEPELPIPD
jgi:hypothetical protein